jgi:hypothetical protein
VAGQVGVPREHGARVGSSVGGVVVTPRVTRIVARAMADKSGARVTPLDLLQAIITDGGGVAARVLASLTSPERARTAS